MTELQEFAQIPQGLMPANMSAVAGVLPEAASSRFSVVSMKVRICCRTVRFLRISAISNVRLLKIEPPFRPDGVGM